MWGLSVCKAQLFNVIMNIIFHARPQCLLCDNINLILQYPHLVHGAVASSAPVQAVTNFEGYNEVVADSLKSELVGGSQEVR